MKTLKNQIIEILDKNLSAYQLCHDDDPIEIAGKGNAASEIESAVKSCQRTEEELREYLLKWHEGKGNFSIKDLMTWLYGNL